MSSPDQSFNTAQEEDAAVKFVYSAELKSTAVAVIFKSEGNPKTLCKVQVRTDWPLWKEVMN
jgi:hypothetical protein